MLIIDGSLGEGGGQILRTSLALSLVTQTPVRIEKIRARRSRPGLLRQHLAAARAAAAIGAEVEGAELGASELTLRPGPVRGGSHAFAVGSAGSACLVLQTVLPALLATGQAARLTLQGGTHNPSAPPFDFLDRVFVPLLSRMGAPVSAELERAGFYPAGGGEITVEVGASRGLRGVELMERGALVSQRARASVAHLSADIAKRELAEVQRRLGLAESELEIRQVTDSAGPGNVIFVEVEHESCRELCTGFGEKAVKAERVARRAIGDMRRYLKSSAPVGVRLADQLMLPLAIAGEGLFRTLPLSEHSRTNIEVIEAFLPGRISIREDDEGATLAFSGGR
jgi:RNA 3'-terminal phosphate cyclase (ATP)